MVSLVSFLDENARRQPGHLACVVGDDSLSYAELHDASCRFAGALTSIGLQPGDRVSLYMPNSAAYVACYLGVMRAGMIANPVNGVLTPHEVGYMLADSAPPPWSAPRSWRTAWPGCSRRHRSST
jgi:long-chain acyl-CoA synthetase